MLATALLYLGLGALLTCEEAGVFLLPGDISLVAAGVYAARGGPFILGSWVAAVLGMAAGSSLLFYTVRGSRRSRRVLPGRLNALIQRHGALGVGVGRLIPGLRNVTVFAAAAARLSPARFYAGLLPATAAWSALLLGLGWFGGHAILTLLGRLDAIPGLKAASFALVLLGVAFVIFRGMRPGQGETTEISRHIPS